MNPFEFAALIVVTLAVLTALVRLIVSQRRLQRLADRNALLIRLASMARDIRVIDVSPTQVVRVQTDPYGDVFGAVQAIS